MRTIRLSKELTDDIHTTAQHFIENQDRKLSQDYEELRDMCKHDNRFRMVVTLEERIPYCSDIIVNILVKHILDIVDCNEDDTEEMNAFCNYLEEVHGMPIGPLLSMMKEPTVDALEIAVRWLINALGGDA